jgi:sugar (pentulose or hexulose) kinase
LYLAFMTELSIEALGVDGDVLVDGPLATNPFFGSILSDCLSRPVYLSAGDTGNTRAACFLAGFADAPVAPTHAAEAIHIKELRMYRDHWRREVAQLRR